MRAVQIDMINTIYHHASQVQSLVICKQTFKQSGEFDTWLLFYSDTIMILFPS